MAVAEWVIPFERLADEVESRIGQRPFIEHTGGGIWAVFLPVLPDDKSGDICKPHISLAIYWEKDDGPLATYEVGGPTLGVFPSSDGTYWTDVYMDVDTDSPLFGVYESYDDTFRVLVGDGGGGLLNHDEMVDYVCNAWGAWVGFRDFAPEGVATGLEVTS